MKNIITILLLGIVVSGCNQGNEKMNEAAVREFVISHFENQIGYDDAVEGLLNDLSSNFVFWVNSVSRNSPKPFKADMVSGADFYEDSLRVQIKDVFMMGDHANVMGTVQYYIAGVETGYRNFSGIVTQEKDGLKWIRFVAVDDNNFSHGIMLPSSKVDNVPTLFTAMRNAMMDGINRDAKELSDSLVAADPTWAAAHLGQLHYYYLEKDLENLKKSFDAAVSKLDGASNAERHSILAFDVDREVSQHHIEQALLFAPVDPWLRMWLSLREPDAQRSIDILDLAWKRLPSSGGINNNLGYKYMELKDYNRAKQYFEIYLRTNPNSPNAHDSYGDYYAAVGDTKKAKEMYMKAYELNNSWTESKAKAEAL